MNFYVLHLDLRSQSQLQSLLQIDFYSSKIHAGDNKCFNHQHIVIKIKHGNICCSIWLHLKFKSVKIYQNIVIKIKHDDICCSIWVHLKFKSVKIYQISTSCANCIVPLLAAGLIFNILQNILYKWTLSTTSFSDALLLILGPFICSTASMSCPIVGSNLKGAIQLETPL